MTTCTRTLLAALAAGLIGLPSGSASAANVYVNSVCGNDAWTGANPTCVATTGPKATIGAAVAAALANDTIIVAAGTYTENVTINKVLTMQGAQAGVDARGRVASESIVVPAAPGTSAFNIAFSGTIVIDGFSFNGGTALGLMQTSVGPNNNMQIVNNIFSGYSGAAVFMNRGGSDITIDKNVMNGSNIAGSGQAIFSNGPQSYTGLYITNNNIINNTGRYGYFVDGNHNVGESATRAPSISGNLFNNNLQGLNLGSRSFGVLGTPVLGPYGGYINNNTFSNHAANGIQAGIQHVQVSGNTFSGNAASGLVLTSFGNTGVDRGGQNCSVTNNYFLNNAITLPGTGPNFNAGIFCSSTQGVGLISTNHFSGNFISGNLRGATYTGNEVIDMENNWWGSGTGPTDPTGSVLTSACTSGSLYQGDLVNTGGVGDAINETFGANRGVDYCPFLTASISLNPTSTCYHVGNTVTVHVDMSGQSGNIVGGQFFLGYNTSKLTFASMTVGSAPFTVQVYRCTPTDLPSGPCVPIPGFIDYAVGVPFGNPGTTADTTMAVITFTAAAEICNTSGLVYFRPHDPPSRLTNNLGDPVAPPLVDLSAISIDDTLPVISPGASNQLVECDGAGNTAQLNAWLASHGGASATDSCSAVTWSNNFTALSDLCGATGAATVQFKATDACGNFSTTSATFTIQDTTLPSITCPPNVGPISADSAGCSATLTKLVDFETIGGYTLAADGAGSSTRSTNQAFTGSWSARLLLPSGSADFAKVVVPVSNIKLGNASGMFQTYVAPGSASNLVPYMYFEVDSNQNGIFDFTGNNSGDSFVIAFITGSNPVPQGRWLTQGLRGSTVIHVVGNRTGLLPTQFSSSNGGGLLSALRATTYSGATTWGDPALTAARVGAGEWPGASAYDAYVDDILVTRYLETPAASSDTCDTYPVVTASRSDLAPMSAPFAAGVTTVTWKATDDCGNMNTCPQTVTVTNTNVMLVSIELAGGGFTGTNFTRCIRFELHRCGFPGPVIVDANVNFVDGSASGVPIDVPCGLYDCITARDRKHTLRRTADPIHFGMSGTQYFANFVGTDALLGGNLNDDMFVDILDFGGFAGQYNTSPGANTPCGYVGINADISGDGLVFIEDFSFIQINFLVFSEANCCGLLNQLANPDPFDPVVRSDKPVTSISVKELNRRGLGDLTRGDLNHDGMLDAADIAAFMGGGSA